MPRTPSVRCHHSWRPHEIGPPAPIPQEGESCSLCGKKYHRSPGIVLALSSGPDARAELERVRLCGEVTALILAYLAGTLNTQEIERALDHLQVHALVHLPIPTPTTATP